MLFVALGASLTLNVFQYYSQLRVKGEAASRLELPRGDEKLSSLHLASVDGSKLEVSFGPEALPTLVYVMSPTCKCCELNLPKVNRLATQLEGRYRIIGLSSRLNGELPPHAYSFPLYEVDSRFPAPPITLDATPRTLIFSPDGHFVKGWDGAYINETGKEVGAFFKVDLADGR